MKKDIEKINLLKKERDAFIAGKAKTTDSFILNFLNEKIEEKNKEIHIEENRKEPKSNIRVKFNGSKREIYNKTARETYKQTILEFGVNKVKPYFPGLFVKDTNDQVNNLFVADNTYLKAQISNDAMKKHIDDIAEKLGVNVTVTIIKK